MKIYSISNTFTQWEALASLFAEYYAQLAQHKLSMTLIENGEKLWIEALKKSVGKTSFLIVAEENGVLVGFAQAQIKLAPDYLGNTRIGHLAHIFVKENFRGGESAQSLFLEAKTWFEEKKVDSIELQIVQGNIAAEKFWKKLGFVVELEQLRMKI